MAKHPARCPKCGGPLQYESAVDEKIVCPQCQVLLSVPGKVKPSDKVDPLLGQTLGEFVIEELLGRGGMGAVYKAKQPALGRFVAVKVLPRSLASDADFIERFQREARAAAAVSHPNIIHVLTVGQDKGYQFIAMEFVEGESLAETLKRDGALPTDRALDLFKQVAGALAMAHGKGIVHRDIKPANILLTADGHAKLADFGLAKRTATDVTVTQTGAMMGTPLYFPPEAARSERYDTRSDLYSLGATFYHLLAGKPPFAGNNAMMLAVMHTNDPVPPLRQAAPDAPAALCGIIHRLLQKKAENRFQTADELLVALNSLSPRERAGVRAPGPGAAAADTPTLQPGAPHPPLSRRERAGTGTRPYILIGAAAAIALVVLLVLILGPSRRVAQPPSAVVTVPKPPTPTAQHPTPPVVPPTKKIEPLPKKEPTPEPPKPTPETKKEEPPKPEPKVAAKEDEDAKKEAEEERQRVAEAAKRDARARGLAAYAEQSDKVWALFRERKYEEADRLLANLPQVPNLREVVEVDREALRLLKEFWAAAERSLAAKKGRFVAFGGAGGAIVDAQDGQVTLQAGGAEVKLPIHKLTVKQALAYAELKDDARSDLMRGVLLLADGAALDEAAAALDKAGDSPSVAIYRERLSALKMGSAEAAAQKAWLAIQEEAKGKITPATAKRLTDMLAAFEKAHDQTKLHKGLAKDLAELRTRIEDCLGYTQWPFDEKEAKRRQKATAEALGVKVEQDIDLGNGVKMTFVLIPAGEFLMGSPPTTSPEKLAAVYGGDPKEYEREFPQHRVKISQPFWMAKHEVTQEQWMAVLPTNPSGFADRPKNPVEKVDWNQASGFAKVLSERLHKTFRLPTEAEWEYACRAGTATEFYFGNDVAKIPDFGWCSVHSTAPVGAKKPNAWGLCDMAGNVWEWVEDLYGKYESGAQTDPRGQPAGKLRVLRGGSWSNDTRNLRSAYRGPDVPGLRHNALGFHVVLAQQGTAVATPSPATPPQPVAVGPSKVYAEWPFDEAEAKRRQAETAKAIGVKVEQDIDLGNGVKMTFVLIPAGEFLMGSPPTTSPQKLVAAYGAWPKDYETEFPQHRVRISRPFWMGKYEVMQEQWMAISQTSPGRSKDKPKNPAEPVSWNNCQEFLQKLSAKLKRTFRLPTEAEWEYSCRAGTATEFYFGNDAARIPDFGWMGGGSSQPVGQKKPNAWGLFDMVGNVGEWCEDCPGTYERGAQTDPKGAPAGGPRVWRGGSWNHSPRFLRSAYREAIDPGIWHYYGLGFRVVLTAEGK